ncbi:S8 family serine peptidase [Candidatus Bathyarchaeota archaeon]|nr:S8 family serine peptidase [Candidatus Bathyarchaeota archaeon]
MDKITNTITGSRKTRSCVAFLLVCINIMLFFPTGDSGVQRRWESTKGRGSQGEISLHDITRASSIDELFGLNDLFWKLGITGTGSTLAVVDTGINASHEVFQGKSVHWKDVSPENYSSSMDLDGHGTMCASLGVGNASGFTGSAPGANLAAIKMFYMEDGSPTAENIDALNAVNYIIDQASTLNITVASCSWGDDNDSADGRDELSQIMATLPQHDVITVVAQGNREVGLSRVAAPGAAPSLITVGSFDEDLFGVASHNLIGPNAGGHLKPDVIAPGVDLEGAALGGGYRIGSGTSYATPVAAGIFLLIKEKYPSMNHTQVKHLACMAALETRYTSGSQDNHEGWGLLNPVGMVMLQENKWNSTEQQNVSIPLTPWNASTRSYFTKLQVSPGSTHVVKLAIDQDLGEHYQAYIFQEEPTANGVPVLLSRSHGGLLFFTASKGNQYYLAIKPLPSAWNVESSGIVPTMRLECTVTDLIDNALIGGIIMAILGIAIAIAISVQLIHELQKRRNGEEMVHSRGM